MAVVDQHHPARRYIAEIEEIIRNQHPEAKFLVTPTPDDEEGIAIWTYSNAESEEIRELVGDRELEILLGDDIEILAIAMPLEAWED